VRFPPCGSNNYPAGKILCVNLSEGLIFGR
jgi:hypothetical protein